MGCWLVSDPPGAYESQKRRIRRRIERILPELQAVGNQYGTDSQKVGDFALTERQVGMKDESKVLMNCLVITTLSLVSMTYKYVALITMSPPHNDAVAGDNTEEHSKILPYYPEIGMSPEQVDKVWTFECLEEACHVGTNDNDVKLVTYREGADRFFG